MPVYISGDKRELLAKISGEIDHHSSRWLRADIDTAIRDKHPSVLRLDFSDVTFMDSSGVGLVMGRYKELSAYGGEIELINMPEYIEKVMTLAGMDKLVTFEKKETLQKERKIKNG